MNRAYEALPGFYHLKSHRVKRRAAQAYGAARRAAEALPDSVPTKEQASATFEALKGDAKRKYDELRDLSRDSVTLQNAKDAAMTAYESGTNRMSNWWRTRGEDADLAKSTINSRVTNFGQSVNEQFKKVSESAREASDQATTSFDWLKNKAGFHYEKLKHETNTRIDGTKSSALFGFQMFNNKAEEATKKYGEAQQAVSKSIEDTKGAVAQKYVEATKSFEDTKGAVAQKYDEAQQIVSKSIVDTKDVVAQVASNAQTGAVKGYTNAREMLTSLYDRARMTLTKENVEAESRRRYDLARNWATDQHAGARKLVQQEFTRRGIDINKEFDRAKTRAIQTYNLYTKRPEKLQDDAESVLNKVVRKTRKVLRDTTSAAPKALRALKHASWKVWYRDPTVKEQIHMAAEHFTDMYDPCTLLNLLDDKIGDLYGTYFEDAERAVRRRDPDALLEAIPGAYRVNVPANRDDRQRELSIMFAKAEIQLPKTADDWRALDAAVANAIDTHTSGVEHKLHSLLEYPMSIKEGTGKIVPVVLLTLALTGESVAESAVGIIKHYAHQCGVGPTGFDRILNNPDVRSAVSLADGALGWFKDESAHYAPQAMVDAEDMCAQGSYDPHGHRLAASAAAAFGELTKVVREGSKTVKALGYLEERVYKGAISKIDTEKVDALVKEAEVGVKLTNELFDVAHRYGVIGNYNSAFIEAASGADQYTKEALASKVKSYTSHAQEAFNNAYGKIPTSCVRLLEDTAAMHSSAVVEAVNAVQEQAETLRTIKFAQGDSTAFNDLDSSSYGFLPAATVAMLAVGGGGYAAKRALASKGTKKAKKKPKKAARRVYRKQLPAPEPIRSADTEFNDPDLYEIYFKTLNAETDDLRSDALTAGTEEAHKVSGVRRLRKTQPGKSVTKPSRITKVPKSKLKLKPKPKSMSVLEVEEDDSEASEPEPEEVESEESESEESDDSDDTSDDDESSEEEKEEEKKAGKKKTKRGLLSKLGKFTSLRHKKGKKE
jgi:hypothetical protein